MGECHGQSSSSASSLARTSFLSDIITQFNPAGSDTHPEVEEHAEEGEGPEEAASQRSHQPGLLLGRHHLSVPFSAADRITAPLNSSAGNTSSSQMPAALGCGCSVCPLLLWQHTTGRFSRLSGCSTHSTSAGTRPFSSIHI